MPSGSVLGIRGRGIKRPSRIAVEYKDRGGREEGREEGQNECFCVFSFRLLGLYGLMPLLVDSALGRVQVMTSAEFHFSTWTGGSVEDALAAQSVTGISVSLYVLTITLTNCTGGPATTSARAAPFGTERPKKV